MIDAFYPLCKQLIRRNICKVQGGKVVLLRSYMNKNVKSRRHRDLTEVQASRADLPNLVNVGIEYSQNSAGDAPVNTMSDGGLSVEVQAQE